MMDKRADIFGKIDALLGKRGGEALADNNVINDDFPLLTDVIEPEREHTGTDRRANDGGNYLERRKAQRRRQSDAASIQPGDDADKALLFSELESRLSRLFEQQQDALRKLVQEELLAGQRNLEEKILAALKKSQHKFR
jgi:hypothetical protein